MKSDTNVWDMFVIFFMFIFILAMFGGTAMLVQIYGWSIWWMAFSFVMVSSIQIKTGMFNDEIAAAKKLAEEK